MALDRFNENMDIIAGLGDDPKRDDGLSTPQFKSVFDKAGLLIQKFLNEKLIPQVENFLDEGTVLGKITEALSRKLDKTGGTMEGPINMNGQKLFGLNEPTADDEAATKGYVVDAVKEAAPYNYADNSDFTQWVAQAGLAAAHEVDEIYAGDRWILDNGTVTGDARDDGNGYTNIKLNGTIKQRVANPPAIGTAFVEMVSGTADISYTNNEITITSNGGVIKNVRLFKGLYTSDNAHAYQPKGYVTELYQCMFYYRKYIKETRFVGYISSSAKGFYFTLDRPMRVTPTVTNSAKFIIRTVSGYSSAAQYDNPSSPKTAGANGSSAPYINLVWETALGTNNTPVVAEIYSGSLEFCADL